MLAENPDFGKNIIFSDEANFWPTSNLKLSLRRKYQICFAKSSNDKYGSNPILSPQIDEIFKKPVKNLSPRKHVAFFGYLIEGEAW